MSFSANIAFAVAAHLDSEILIMDEVLAVGDMAFQQKCLGKMSDVSTTEGRTVLYVSHNMNTIRQLCDRCIVLDRGKIIFNGDVEEAIDIYLNRNRGESLTSIDISKIERDRPELGKKGKLLFFEFLGKDTPVFKKDESIRFRLKYDKVDANYKYKLLIPIRYMGSNTVGSYLSPVLENEDDSYTINLSNLTPGKYSFTLALYAINDFGTSKMCDHSIEKFMFEISSDDKVDIDWQRKW